MKAAQVLLGGNEYLEFFIEISGHFWDTGNCIVDKLARAGLELATFDTLRVIGVSIASIRLSIVLDF